jgi:hypothetical protein
MLDRRTFVGGSSSRTKELLIVVSSTVYTLPCASVILPSLSLRNGCGLGWNSAPTSVPPANNGYSEVAPVERI